MKQNGLFLFWAQKLSFFASCCESQVRCLVAHSRPLLSYPVVPFWKIMARSLNKVLLIGNLGKDAETKFTPSGAAVTRFSVATTRRWKDQQTNDWKEETNWTNVSLWRQENLANYLTKGKQVYVEGRLQTRSYDDKDGKKVYATEVVAEDVILLSGRGEGEEGGPSRAAGAPGRGRGGSGGPAPAEDDFGGMNISDDDVPF
jgi:single-strand DNA-binding protein